MTKPGRQDRAQSNSALPSPAEGGLPQAPEGLRKGLSLRRLWSRRTTILVRELLLSSVLTTAHLHRSSESDPTPTCWGRKREVPQVLVLFKVFQKSTQLPERSNRHDLGTAGHAPDGCPCRRTAGRRNAGRIGEGTHPPQVTEGEGMPVDKLCHSTGRWPGWLSVNGQARPFSPFAGHSRQRGSTRSAPAVGSPA